MTKMCTCDPLLRIVELKTSPENDRIGRNPFKRGVCRTDLLGVLVRHHEKHLYKEKWVILFLHSANFTPVCKIEFVTFASILDEFKALNTKLVRLSVDTLCVHIAWLRKIQKLKWNGIKNPEVTFSLIKDIRTEVVKKYDMTQPGASNT